MALHDVQVTPGARPTGVAAGQDAHKLNWVAATLTIVGVWIGLACALYMLPPLGPLGGPVWVGILTMIMGAALWRWHRSVALGLLIGPPLGLVAVPPLMMGGFFLVLLLFHANF